MAAALTIRWARSPQARAGEGALTSKKINTQAERPGYRTDLDTPAALRELFNMSLALPQKPPEESQSLFASARQQPPVSWGTRPAFLSAALTRPYGPSPSGRGAGGEGSDRHSIMYTLIESPRRQAYGPLNVAPLNLTGLDGRSRLKLKCACSSDG